MSYQKKKILLISSGSGGHAVPILELYKELITNIKYDVVIYHSGSEIENELFKGTGAVKIISGKLNRHEKTKNIFEGIKLIFGFVEVFCLLLFKRPNLIVSKGGFLSVPILGVAKIFRIPIFLHESDIVLGLSNKLFVDQAEKIFVSFPTENYKIEDDVSHKLIYSGLIVRKFEPEAPSKPKQMPVIYILGGSQGARDINETVVKLLPKLLIKYKIIHQTGQKDYLWVESAAKELEPELKKNYTCFDFSLSKGAQSLVSADLVLSRAGANTIGELILLMKPAILIPYPYASGDHQLKNARFLEKQGSVIVLRQENLSSDSLRERIDYLLGNKDNLRNLSEKIAKAIKINGTEIIAKEIDEFLLMDKMH